MRVDYKRRREVAAAMRALKEAEDVGGLEPELLELVRIRASQLNGCARCMEIHTKDMRAMGEDPMRVDLVAVWRESPCYSPRERAALAWTEELTLLTSRTVPDAFYDETRAVFSEDELVQLTMAVITINAWNRLGVAFRATVGTHVPRVKAPSAGAAEPKVAEAGSPARSGAAS